MQQAVADETRHKILDMLTLGESLLLTLAAHRTQTGHALHGRIGQYTVLATLYTLDRCVIKKERQRHGPQKKKLQRRDMNLKKDET